MLSAAGYTRVSTPGQKTDGLSIEEQTAVVRAYCAREGLTLLAVYSDDFTGRVLSRPGLEQLRAHVAAGGVDLIVLTKTSRLARKAHRALYLEDELESLGVEVRYVDQQFERTAFGRFHRTNVAAFDELETELIRERTMSGRRRKVLEKHAQPCGNAPFGYSLITRAQADVLPEYAGRSGELLELEEEARVVRKMFALVAAGRTLRAVAVQLHEEATPTRKGGRWSPWTVREVIERTCYHTGQHWFGRRECRVTETRLPSGRLHVRKRPTDPSAWLAVPCPPLVEPGVWYAANERLRANAEDLRGRNSYAWPLSGCVFCARCKTQRGTPRACAGRGRTRKGSVYRKYCCTSAASLERGERCGTAYPAEVLEARAWGILQQAAGPGWLAAQQARRRGGGDPAGQERAARAALEALESEELEAARLILKGVSERTTQKLLADVGRRRAHAEKRLAAAQARLAEAGAVGDVEAVAAALAARLGEARKDPQKAQELFRAFLRLTIGGGRVRVEVRVPPVEGV